jgi:iron complex transport system ATP-binding protein
MNSPPSITVNGVSISYADTNVLTEVSVDIPAGSFVGLVGPNGSGKTTLLRAMHRALQPSTGSVLVDQRDLWRMSPKESARQIAVVAQDTPAEFDFTAAEVAAMGRIPHKSGFAADDDTDRRLVLESLDALGVAHLAHRQFMRMSGGERQRTLIARALVQQSSVLILDEPTNHLDIRYQLDVLHRVRDLGMTTIAALHDLNLASAWCDYVFVIDGGRIVAAAEPHDALSPELIRAVFGVTVIEVMHPRTGRKQLLFERDADVDDCQTDV